MPSLYDLTQSVREASDVCSVVRCGYVLGKASGSYAGIRSIRRLRKVAIVFVNVITKERLNLFTSGSSLQIVNPCRTISRYGSIYKSPRTAPSYCFIAHERSRATVCLEDRTIEGTIDLMSTAWQRYWQSYGPRIPLQGLINWARLRLLE